MEDVYPLLSRIGGVDVWGILSRIGGVDVWGILSEFENLLWESFNIPLAYYIYVSDQSVTATRQLLSLLCIFEY